MNLNKPVLRGFTLVELMIAMALGLFLVGAAIRVVMVNQRTFQLAENQARLQENVRTAFELLAHDIRSAGGNPCGANQVQTNNLNGSAGLWWANWAGGSIRGFENSQIGDAAQGIVPVPQRLAGTDAIVVMSANSGDSNIAVLHNTAAVPQSFTLASIQSAQTGLQQGDIVMACDESNAAIFQITNNPTNGTAIIYAAGNANVPQGTPGNQAASFVGGYTFPNGAFVARLHSAFWYVGPNQRGSNSLYRLTFTGRFPFTTEEIVDGVTDLQLQYIERNASIISPPAPAPAPLSNWIPANLVTQWAFAPAQFRVEGVNIALTLRSRDSVGVDANGIAQPLTTVLNETIYLRSREYN